MTYLRRILDNLFCPDFGIALKITLISQLVILLFASVTYGDAPIELKISCETASGVYEYNPGDKVTLHITAENVGRPFEKDQVAIDVLVYQRLEDGTDVSAEDPNYRVFDEGFTHYFLNTGDTYEGTYELKIKENAPPGKYSVLVRVFGCNEEFQNLIVIK